MDVDKTTKMAFNDYFQKICNNVGQAAIWGLVVYVVAQLYEYYQRQSRLARLRQQQAAAAAASTADAAAGAGSTTGAGAKADQEPDVDQAVHKAQIDALMRRAQQACTKMGDEKLTLEHMVLALAENQRFGEILQCAEGLAEEDLKKAIKKSRLMFNHTDSSAVEIADVPATALSKYGRDLTGQALAGRLDPLIGRDDELRRAFQVLVRRTKNNPVVLGESGVGKTALVEGLAQRIASGDCPAALKGAAIVALDMGSIMAGAMFPGEFEQRMNAVLKEIAELPKQPPAPVTPGGPPVPPPSSCILFIDDMHTITGPNAQQGGGVMDAGMLLKPLLARGELRCIGATTPDKFRRFIEKDPALERRFQQVPLAQPSVSEATSILRGLRKRYEMHHGVRITDAALVAAVELSNKYIPDRYLPDKAIDLVDEATARVKLDMDQRPEQLDRLERRITLLDAERKLLRRSAGSDRRDAAALVELEATLAGLKAQRDGVVGQVKVEVGEARALQAAQEEADRLQIELEDEEEGRSEAALSEGADRPKTDAERIKADRARTKRLEELRSKMTKAQVTARTLRAEISYKTARWASGGEVSEGDIATVISAWTGIPLTKLVESERDNLLKLADELHRRIIGQEEAVSAVSEAIQRSRAGMKDPNGPIASFLFLGPTGVGKTELAKAVASFLFNSEDAMVRLDMSEYMEKHAVSKLIGAPPGYVGFDEGGQLTEAVRRRPYSVVLFDEVEKAHVDVFNLLLQLLDDGRVTDSQGRTVSFKHCIIIMTSNLGSGEIYRVTAGRQKQAAQLGAAAVASLPSIAADPQIRDVVMDQVRKHFPPEFLNRVDEFIIFEPLSHPQIRKVVLLRTAGVVSRLAEKKVKLVLRDSALDFLATKGYDPIFGARPVKRAIQRELETPLAQALLRGEFEEDDSVVVTHPYGPPSHLAFKRVRPGEAPPTDEKEQQGGQQQGAPAAREDDELPPLAPHAAAAAAAGSTSGVSSSTAKAAANGVADGTSSSSSKGPKLPSLPPRQAKFDPLKQMTALHAAGEDISRDGAEANRDNFSLPASEG